MINPRWNGCIDNETAAINEGLCIEDFTENSSLLRQPSDYYPLTIRGMNECACSSPIYPYLPIHPIVSGITNSSFLIGCLNLKYLLMSTR